MNMMRTTISVLEITDTLTVDIFIDHSQRADLLGTFYGTRNRYFDVDAYLDPTLPLLSQIGYDSLFVPVFALAHGNVSFKAGQPMHRGGRDPFGHLYMGMDSGLAGYYVVSRERVRDYFGWARITAKRKQRVLDYLVSEIEAMNAQINDELYGYAFEDDEGEILSQRGCVGMDSLLGKLNAQIDTLLLDADYGERLIETPITAEDVYDS